MGDQYFGRRQTQLCTLRGKYFVVANLVQSMWATCVMTGKGRARSSFVVRTPQDLLMALWEEFEEEFCVSLAKTIEWHVR